MARLLRNFINGEIYHVILRRIGNELLFGDVDDYYRGIFYIYECNTSKPILIRERRTARAKFKKLLKKIEADRGLTPAEIAWRDERDLLVEVLAFCLMPNHIHLLLRQLKDKGISKYIQKIASGYPAYFKQKYKITLRGHFFQDRFQAVYIKDEEHLKVALTYIHTNPTLLVEPEWKWRGVKNPEKVIEFLENYKWSSYQDYLGKRNFPSVTQREFVLKVMGGPEGCREWVNGWIKYQGEIRKTMEKFSHLSLETA